MKKGSADACTGAGVYAGTYAGTGLILADADAGEGGGLVPMTGTSMDPRSRISAVDPLGG